MYKILVVDDEPKIAELLKVCLEMQGMEVSCAENGREALENFAKNPADMILTDIMMPVMDGYEFVSELRKRSNVPVMFLTAKGDILDLIKGLNVGADDYLVKPFEMDELKVRVRALLKRSHKIPESMATKELLIYKEVTLLPESYSVKINDKVAKLTPIEFEIFYILFQNHGNMVSSKKLLKDIWGYDPDDDIETIRVHIRHLRSKISKISDGKNYIETIYGGGYKLNI